MYFYDGSHDYKLRDRAILYQFSTLTYHIAIRVRVIPEQQIGGRYSIGCWQQEGGRRDSKEPLLLQPRTALIGVGIWAEIIE